METEIDRIVRLAREFGIARQGYEWPELTAMCGQPDKKIDNLAGIVIYLAPWEWFLAVDRDPSPILRAAAAGSHRLNYKGGWSNLGLPVHQFGERKVYAEWQKRCGEMRELISRLATDEDQDVREAAARSPWLLSEAA